MKKGLVLFTILLFPSLFYIFLSTGKHNAFQVEIFGPRDSVWVTANGQRSLDTVMFHTLPEWSFTDQTGQTLSSSDVKGKIVVADFFFASCQSICPQMGVQLTEVQKKFKDDDEVLILSYTVDPTRDTVEAFAEYSKRFKADSSKWKFLTGEKKDLYSLARDGYLLPVPYGIGDENDFIHSEQMVLIDKQGRIRGYFDGTNGMEVKELMQAIQALKFDDLVPRKEKENA